MGIDYIDPVIEESENICPVTIGIPNFNGEQTLVQTITSIKKLNYSDYVIMLVDDGSTDRSVEKVRMEFSDVQILEHKGNRGVSAARNTILQNSKTDLVFLVDNDVELDPQSLKYLVRPLMERKEVVVATPRIVLKEKKLIQSDGTKIHYVCAPIHFNRYLPMESMQDTVDEVDVDCGSGGMMLINKRLSMMIEGFDEDFRFGWADGEFMIRASLSGLKCCQVPRAIVYHKEKTWGMKRSFYQMRNRWFIILINYSPRTLLVVSPMLFLYEVLLFVFATGKGRFLDYVKSWLAIVGSFKSLVRKRKKMQSRKVLNDRIFFHSGEITGHSGVVRGGVMIGFKNLINAIFDGYWKLALKWNIL